MIFPRRKSAVKGKSMKKLIVAPQLDRKLRKRAAEIAAASKYPSEVAHQAALVEALKVGDAIVVDGVVRELKPTAADGRIAG